MLATLAASARFLSVNDLRARWSCSRAYVYKALAEMERASYLQRIYLGSVQRVSLDSIETWERLHSSPQGESRAEVSTLRRQRAVSTKASTPGPSLREAWAKLKAAG
jgi:hypothetical protein